MATTNNKAYVGLDPGKDGAYVIITPNKTIETHGYPFIGNEYDFLSFFYTLNRLKKRFEEIHAIVEWVTPFQESKGKGKANWSLSRGFAMIEMGLIGNAIPYTRVTPKVWQKEMWQGVKPITKKINRKKKDGSYVEQVDPKPTSKLAARRLFPMTDKRSPYRKTEQSTIEHDGVIDALLMAEFGRRKNY